jgi:hypothetical protein
MLGCLPIGGAATIRSTDGSPLFRITLEAVKGHQVHEDPNANFKLTAQRSSDGGMRKLTINFDDTSMEYSTINENMSQRDTLRGIKAFGGFAKPVPKA